MRISKLGHIVRIATSLADKSYQVHKHGCVALNKRGEIVGYGYNRWAPCARNIDKYLQGVREFKG